MADATIDFTDDVGKGYPVDFSTMIGKVLSGVALSQDKERITFTFADGTVRVFGVEGDCCSTSWVEHLEGADDVAGATLTAVGHSEPVTMDGHPVHDCLQVYWTRFRTTKGDVILEYRNSSNGYYGGYLCEVPQ